MSMVRDLYIGLRDAKKSLDKNNFVDILKQVVRAEDTFHGKPRDNEKVPSHQEIALMTKGQAVKTVRQNLIRKVNLAEKTAIVTDGQGIGEDGVYRHVIGKTDPDVRAYEYKVAGKVAKQADAVLAEIASLKDGTYIICDFSGTWTVTYQSVRRFINDDIKVMKKRFPSETKKRKKNKTAKPKAKKPKEKPVQLNLL